MLSLFLAAALLSADEMRPCDPHEQAGAILTVTGIAARNKAQPFLHRHGQDGTPEEYELLCPDDDLVNPKDSGVSIHYRLSGHEAKLLAPGDSPVHVSATEIPLQIAMYSERLRSLFDYMSRGVEGVRGGGSDNSIYPLPPQTYAVADWGPLILAWRGTSTGTVTINSGADTKSLSGKGVVKVDLATYCPSSCSMSVLVPANKISSSTTITNLPAAQAIATLKITQFDPRQAPMLLPSWFVAQRREPAWRLQEASVVWNGTCDYPAYERSAREFYDIESVVGACGK